MDSPDTEVKALASNCSLRELADSTVSAFAILRPWTLETTNGIASFQPITCQVARYVRALKFSILAAGYGYAYATEAIYLSEEKLRNVEGRGEPLDTENYISTMTQIAEKGHRNAKEAHRQFRDVRIELAKVIDKTQEKLDKQAGNSAAEGDLDLSRLKRGIPVLEEFGVSVKKYATWWNIMVMNGFTIGERCPKSGIPDRLRYQGVIAQWEKIKDDYAAYTDRIGTLEDDYPHLLKNEELTSHDHPHCQEASDSSDPGHPMPRDPGTTSTLIQRLLHIGHHHRGKRVREYLAGLFDRDSP